ncbi:uncharacterized protein PAC_03145 [Phialocephala subalpina]|uniref:Uncharacterized protein n=1 Tax=Phialocephala subalpina TaxID=576137 RepID=A0A1L7WKG4_9HELO|nr:uncharacterized protein PAC_03145 [Phialocephala subalpina]
MGDKVLPYDEKTLELQRIWSQPLRRHSLSERESEICIFTCIYKSGGASRISGYQRIEEAYGRDLRICFRPIFRSSDSACILPPNSRTSSAADYSKRTFPSTPPLSPRDPNLPIEPYDEQAIVSSITAIYDILLALKYLVHEDIIYPPSSGHQINVQLCEFLSLDKRVISLMQRLPYPNTGEDFWQWELIHDSRTMKYIDEDDIKEGRDPEKAGWDDPRFDYLLPTDVALTIGGRYGTTLVLDTKENTIRVIEGQDWPESHESMERPADPSHYRNFPPEPALEALRRYMHIYRSLSLIPRRGGYPLDKWDRKKHPELKRILMEEYGWPDSFRREALAEDYERIWYEVDNRFQVD